MKKTTKTAATETRTCAECGGTTRRETRPDTIEYKGSLREVETTGWWCGECGEATLNGEALAAREKAFFELRAEVDGVLSPSEVVEIRKRLGISQRRAGELLGGGPRAFQKYEKGTASVSAPMSNLLRLLAKDPRRLKELERRSSTSTIERNGKRRVQTHDV
ncbi:MAG: type II toxin-antitoxin system MqsA family antitoxin [Deltaproteobacteria bacterium]|nr:type II toxin-antitoxin system MqsA family antitoxin [Deltaproteobacteria bacterium]